MNTTKTEVETSQIDEVVIKEIADDSILNSCKRDGKKLPKNYTSKGWSISGAVD